MSLGLRNGVTSPENYVRKAFEAECSIASNTGSGRNEQLNRSAFAVGQLIPSGFIDRSEAETCLMAAAHASGYVRKDGAPAAKATIKSGLDEGIRKPRDIPSNGAAAAEPIKILRPAPKLDDVSLPDMTLPDVDGRPKLYSVGKTEPARFPEEMRRHVYWRDGQPVRVRIKNAAGSSPAWLDTYRVRRPTAGAIGWQAKKPEGFVPVPYIGPPGTVSPFGPEHIGEILVWAEGEKDVDTLLTHGFLAFTFGSASDVPDCRDLVQSHHVILCVDNDPAGEKSITRKIAAVQGAAASVKLVQFPELKEGGDATDFFDAGNTAEDFLDRAAPAPEQQQDTASADNPLDDLNRDYCVVLDGGKTKVLHFEESRQKQHTRKVASFIAFDDFKNFHLNRSVQVGDKQIPLGHWWLKHPDRRQYRGLTFEPAGDSVIDGRFNLWRGWGVTPKAGSWAHMRSHIKDVLASGNAAHAAYILNWCAWAVQHPARRAEAAIVFKGRKGTGKGTLGNTLCHIFGQHGTHISSAEHLAGRFNGHLRDVCFLFADEAYWPGDKGAEGSLKRLITEPDLFIEDKGVRGVTVPNMLHCMMASNEDWVVPAGADERRYAVFIVSDTHQQDEAWFTPIYDEMANGGFEAMLHDLLEMDLGDWHPRRIPKTDGLLEQQSQGLRPEDAWWCELLQTGILWGADEIYPGRAVSNSWEDKEDTFNGTKTTRHKGLYDQAREFSPRLKQHSDHLLGSFLTNQGCTNARKVMRRRGWEFPLLTEARAAWALRFPGWKWRDPDLKEWGAE